ncbi:CLUMA_CG007508, isoform A [Clunio marinus]|uniref:CLUMA_CG007508, isoform A n=1 Tax=Clunio marinus TaxID=568069 RepID=A0A1J1I0V6_9DIPT|nr:CLUMA_CG007508, isoform A [Clunio marinus]
MTRRGILWISLLHDERLSNVDIWSHKETFITSSQFRAVTARNVDIRNISDESLSEGDSRKQSEDRKAVLKNGVISGSGFMNSGNVRCGSSVCRPISGVFAKNPLPNGYVHVTTLPAGASNITITELRNSINFLALKSTGGEYIINGNYTVSHSGSYDAAGSTIDYHRFDGSVKDSHHPKRSDGVTEWITSSGPLFEPIHLMVLSQQVNPGIKYEYLLPTSLASSEETSEVDYISSAEDNLPLNYKLKAANMQTNTTSTGKRRRRLSWKVIGFTPCSKSCGGGSQQPIIRCVRGDTTRVYSPKKCAHLKNPVVNESLMKCNSQPCPAFWKIGDYNKCRCGEYDEKTNQTREVKCVQELISGVVIQVNSGACIEDKPISTIPCACVKPSRPSKVETYKHNRQQTTISSRNTQNDQKTTSRNRTRAPSKSKKSGSWLVSEWSEQCSSECGAGQQFRTIFCDRSPPHTDRCDIRLTPNTYRECTSDVRCQGEWFIGPWSLCSGDCFNSSKSRTVVCIKHDGFAEESECDLKSKPATFEDCKPDEMKDCKPKWHLSEWSECNKNCGSGIQRRTIKCLELDSKDKILRDSSKCKYSERPAGMRYCNTHDCSEKTTTYDPRVDMIQNDDDPSCRDEFPNCNMVLKSKLCGYAYYNENCCQSCRMISNELF